MSKSNSVRVMEYVQENPTACNERIGIALGLKTDQVRRCIASHVGRAYIERVEVDGVRWLSLTPAGRNVMTSQRNDDGYNMITGKVKMIHPGRSKIRPCLMCGTRYNSEGPGDRICKSCKGTETWRAAIA